MRKVYIASDHAGVELKSKILMAFGSASLSSHYDIIDMGPHSTESVDYPDYADLVCKKLHGFTLIDSEKETETQPIEVGILICGTGQGMAIRANKYSHIRAALCWTTELAHLAREHNDANIICLGSRTMDHELCQQFILEFLKTPFAGGRHRQRVVKVSSPV